MAAVVFAVGSRPGLSEPQACELAELLGRRRTLASQSAAAKIRAQASRDPDKGETSEDVDLNADERREVAAVLAEERWPEDEPAFAHLRDVLANAG